MPIKVIVADDDAELKFLFTGKFSQDIRERTVEFFFVKDGVEALEFLDAHPDVLLVFADIAMPRLDGLALLKELNERYPLIRTIFISAHYEMQNIRTAMNLGAYDFLPKPVNLDDLDATFHKAIRHAQQFLNEITERKRAENALKKYQEHLEDLVDTRTAELTAANTQLQQEIEQHKEAELLLHQRNKELSLISQISKMFSSSIDLDRVLATVLRSVRHLLNISTTSFWFCIPETGELVCQQAIGEGSDLLAGWRLTVGQGITGQAAQSGKSMLVADTRADSRHDPEFNQQLGLELRSIASIPFRVKGKVIGVLDVRDTEVNRFTKNELRLIEPIAAAAAVAVENARLYTTAQEEISERKKAEDALRESEEKYRTLFEDLKDVFYRVDLEGNILLVSPSVEQLLGYTAKKAIGLNMAQDVFVHPEQWEDLLMFMDVNGQLDNFEVLFKRSDGSFDWGSASAQYYSNGEGEHLGIEGIIRDISMRKQAEIQLMAAHDALQQTNLQLQELNASKDKFFSIISHDLRSPFNIMLGYSQLLDEHFDQYSPEYQKDKIRKMRQSAERLYNLLENLLTWSRIQRGAMEYAPEYLDLGDIVEENLELFLARAEQKQITLRSVGSLEYQVYVDENMVNTVLRNLISNALKFTPSDGRIEVFAKSVNSHVEVAVADTGTGIQEEDIPKLFRIDAQYTNLGTAGEKGTGLGLSLCQDLVEKNGGTVWVESEPGKGTTFWFTLPKQPVSDK